MFTTPVLFLVFNRPDTTALVFEQIKKVQPKYLFIAADGPRKDRIGEQEKCKNVRDLVLNGIDWPCDVKTLFRDENNGCGLAVSGAIDWFFEHVEEGIILEDDTVPTLSFFNFCEVQLRRYSRITDVKIISGNNFQNNITRGSGSYYFTKYVHIWGWATWKRTWESYDYEIRDWETKSILEKRKLFKTEAEFNYWNHIFDLVFKKQIDTWDYQLFYLSITSNGINVVPNKNLVKNVGFMPDSTHTTEPNHKLASLTRHEYNEDKIPLKVEADIEADVFTFNNVYTDANLERPNNGFVNTLLLKIVTKGRKFLKAIAKEKLND